MAIFYVASFISFFLFVLHVKNASQDIVGNEIFCIHCVGDTKFSLNEYFLSDQKPGLKKISSVCLSRVSLYFLRHVL